MRIKITESARKHAITDDEIRCVVDHPILVVPIRSRAALRALLYVGRYDDNEPLIEVIGELVADSNLTAFHAMYLTRGTIVLAGIEDHVDPDDLAGTQRQ